MNPSEIATDTGLIAVCTACGTLATNSPVYGGIAGGLLGLFLRFGLPILIQIARETRKKKDSKEE